MLTKISRFISKNNLIKTVSKPVIVGVSGGMDSIALLDILIKNGYSCIVAHCNFHLRGEESDRDEQFVRKICAGYMLFLHVKHFDTQKYAQENKISIEMAAREQRYAWFEELRNANAAEAIAVGHHADDNIETVLMNMVRGSGLKGLTGMEPRNGYIIRPLLSTSRENIAEYVSQQQLEFVEDSTNAETIYRRNIFRHDIIPKLQEINPSFKSNFQETISILKDVQTFTSGYLELIKKQIVEINEDEIHININMLVNLNTPVYVLYEIISAYGFNADQCKQVYENLDDQSGKNFQSQTHQLLKDRKKIIIRKLSEKSEISIPVFPDSCILFPIKLECELTGNQKISISGLKNEACLNADKLKFPLNMRTIKPGDSFYPLGMRGRKKLSDFFTDIKLTNFEKEDVLVICSEGNIVWVVGHRIDDRYKYMPGCKYVFKIKTK